MAASSQLRTSLHDGQAVSVRVLSRQLRVPLSDARAEMLAYRSDFPTPAVWLLAGTAAEAIEGAASTRQMLLVSDSQLEHARTQFAKAPSETLYALLPAASSSKQQDAAGPLVALRARAHELGPEQQGDLGVIRAKGVEKVSGAQHSAPLTVPVAGVPSKAGSTSADQMPAAASKDKEAVAPKGAGKKAGLDWSRAKAPAAAAAPAPPPAAKAAAKASSKRKMVVESDEEEDEDAVEAMDVDDAPGADEEEERIGYAMDEDEDAQMSAAPNAAVKEAPPKAAEARPAVAGGSGTGRRRVRKTRTVTRKITEKNEKGYRVTRDVTHEEEYSTEESGDETPANAASSSAAARAKPRPSGGAAAKASSAAAAAAAPKPAPAAAAPPKPAAAPASGANKKKAGQQKLSSFFTKPK